LFVGWFAKQALAADDFLGAARCTILTHCLRSLSVRGRLSGGRKK
jgi:hypothetical protein